MLELCKDRKRCKELVDKPELATKALQGRTWKRDMPAGQKIIMHLDEENVTHVIIPQKKDIEATEASFKQLQAPEIARTHRNTMITRCPLSQRGTNR